MVVASIKPYEYSYSVHLVGIEILKKPCGPVSPLTLMVRWLKQLWSCKSTDRELSEKDAIKTAQKFSPALTPEKAKIYVTVR